MRSKVYYDTMYKIDQDKDQQTVKKYLKFFEYITKFIRSL